jgi:hypothetical protein
MLPLSTLAMFQTEEARNSQSALDVIDEIHLVKSRNDENVKDEYETICHTNKKTRTKDAFGHFSCANALSTNEQPKGTKG